MQVSAVRDRLALLITAQNRYPSLAKEVMA